MLVVSSEVDLAILRFQRRFLKLQQVKDFHGELKGKLREFTPLIHQSAACLNIVSYLLLSMEAVIYCIYTHNKEIL